MQAKKDEAKCIYQHYNESGVLDCATFGSRLMILNYWMQIIFLIRKGKSKTTVHFEAISVKNLSKDASLLQKRIAEKDAKRMMQKRRDFTLWCRNTHLCSKKEKISRKEETLTHERTHKIFLCKFHNLKYKWFAIPKACLKFDRALNDLTYKVKNEDKLIWV